MIDDEKLAKKLWAAYGEAANGVTFDGKYWPLPTWEELGDDRRHCWASVAHAAVEIVTAESDPLGHVKEVEDRLDKNRAILWQIFDLLKPVLDLSDDIA